MSVEERAQIGHLKNFFNIRRNIAQLQVTMQAAGSGKQSNDGSETAAVDESYVAEMKKKILVLGEHTVDVNAQRVCLSAGGDAPIAANHGNFANGPCIH